MIYMDGKFGWNIYARKSKDDGLTWSDAVIVRQSYKDPGKNDNVCYACPDFIELPDGKIMVAYQWRYNNGYNDLENTNSNCGIEIIQSINQGESFIAASAKKAFWGLSPWCARYPADSGCAVERRKCGRNKSE